MSGRCARIWQAEAIEDGRLEGAERTSFERHAQGCAECRAELAAFSELRVAARDLPHREWTSLERRRLRLALLGEANERATRSPTRWRKPAFAAALATAAALMVVALHTSTPVPTTSEVPTSPVFEVTAEGAAQWRTEHRGAHTKARLLSGALSIHVQKLKADQTFVLQLPDGQLEVRGTRFRVETDGKHTSRVSVSEGVVALAVNGADERVLRAGDRWARTDRDHTVSEPTAPAPEAPSATPPVRSLPSASAIGDKREAPASLVDREPGKAFSAAMAAFDAGNHGIAEHRFRTFLRQYPGDSRSEDATFLCAVARARQGDREGASRWARRYLIAYPNGLRRREAEALVRAAPNKE